jgi:STE24 endopeptidase
MRFGNLTHATLRMLLLAVLVTPSLLGCTSETPAERAANTYAAQEMAVAPPHANLPDYALPPAALAKAQHLSTLRTRLHFAAETWAILQLFLLLSLGVIAWMRDRAAAVTRNPWLQAYLFLPLFLLARFLLNLPLNLYGHRLSLSYGFSVQRWPSWFADLAKNFALEWLIGGALLGLLFAILRHFPRRWWLIFWLAAVPITLLGVYAEPILVDPLFNHFEPLAAHHPDLSAQLAHMGVPPSRQFLMQASAKVTTPNAYVTGLLGSHRVVVWDTSLTPGQPPSPGVLWMVAHECGHYVLGHILIGTLLNLAGLLPLLWFSAIALRWTIHRFGPRWRILSPADLGAILLLVLIVSLIATIAEPLPNTISRHIEHNADVFGQEAIHGLVPDPQAAVQTENDADGLRTFDDPNPSPWIEFWTYNHPATGRRAAFGHAYNPWPPGLQPKYFKKQSADSRE